MYQNWSECLLMVFCIAHTVKACYDLVQTLCPKALGAGRSNHCFDFGRICRSKTPSLKTYILPRKYQYFLPLLGTLNFLPAWVLQRAREPPNPGRTLLLVERSNLELEPKPNCFQSETNCEKETYYSSNILRRLQNFWKMTVISTHYFFN